MAEDLKLTLVTMAFDAAAGREGDLLAVLSRYVVLTRGHQGCRNVDLCRSMTSPERYVVVQKWESPEAQRGHFDSEEMVRMAQSCEGLLAQRPEIDLLEGLSAHDLA